VLVSASAGNRTGLGYAYADAATATLIRDVLSEVVEGRDAMAITANWNAMVSRTRNLGRPGIVSIAISAVDSALWDLKARLLDLPLVNLLASVRESVPIYGSGGFTSYSMEQLQKQLGAWVERGIPRVKMKSGAMPQQISEEYARPVKRAVLTPNFFSMPTEPTAGSRHWRKLRNLPT
jgi:L-alanine-DL-glutamate epimerase-like enolase superfamily enzyme